MLDSLTVNRKAQISIEFLALVGIFMLLILAGYAFFSTTLNTTSAGNEADAALNTLVKGVEQAASLGPGSIIFLTLEFPDNVVDSSVDANSLSITIEGSAGKTQVRGFTTPNLTGSLPTTPGLHVLRLEVLENGTVLLGNGFLVDPSRRSFSMQAGNSRTEDFNVVNNLLNEATSVSAYIDGDVNQWASITGLAGTIPAESFDDFQVSFNPSLAVLPGNYQGTLKVSGMLDGEPVLAEVLLTVVVSNPILIDCDLNATTHSDALCLNSVNQFGISDTIYVKLSVSNVDCTTPTDANVRMLDALGATKMTWNGQLAPFTGNCLLGGYTVLATDANGTWFLDADSSQADDSVSTFRVDTNTVVCALSIATFSDSTCLISDDEFSNGDTVYVKASTNNCTATDVNIRIEDPSSNAKLSWTDQTISTLGSCMSGGYKLVAGDENGAWSAVAESLQAVNASHNFNGLTPEAPDSWYEDGNYFILSDSNAFTSKKTAYSNLSVLHAKARATQLSGSANITLRVLDSKGASQQSTTLSWNDANKTATGSLTLSSASNDLIRFIKLERESGGSGTFIAGQQVRIGSPGSAPAENEVQFLSTYNAVTGCSGVITDFNVSAGQVLCVRVRTTNLNSQAASALASENFIRSFNYANSESVQTSTAAFIQSPANANYYIAQWTVPATYESDKWYNMHSYVKRSLGASSFRHEGRLQFYVK